MKGLKKLVLAAAVVAPFAHAEMTSIDDVMLSEMTGQAGVTIDFDLEMTIGEIRYVDQDGFGSDADDQGFLTLSNVFVGESENDITAATNLTAQINGVTIDVDGTDGIVIGLGQIGGGLTDSGFAASVLAGAPAVTTQDESQLATGHYWRGLDVTADFGINGAAAGSFKIDNLTNFVPNALVFEGLHKFGMTGLAYRDVAAGATIEAAFDATVDAVLGGSGLTRATANDAQFAQAETAAKLNLIDEFLAGSYVDAYVAIQAGGDDGAEGLTINGSLGFVIEKMAYVDDGREMGIHNFTMFDTDASGNIIGFQIDGLTIDVVAYAGAASGSALKIGGATMTGNIVMGDIYIGNYQTGSIGALAIKDINMSATDIYVYGH